MQRALALSIPLVACALTASAARAEPPAAPRAEARAIAGEGDAQFYEGRCDRAIALWRRADALFHAPTIMLRVARCQALMGKVVDAAATLAAIDGEPALPDEFAAAREAAKQELARMRARIATLRLTVRGAAAPIAIDIDGVTAASGARVDVPIDPGTHRVRVHAAGASWEREIHVGDAEVRALDVPLRSEPRAIAPLQRAIGVATLGTGLAALAAGAGLAAASMQRAAAGEHASTYTIAADVTLACGFVLAAGGGVLLAVDLRPARARSGVVLHASPRSVMLSGSF